MNHKYSMIDSLKEKIKEVEYERIKLLDDQTKLAKLYEMWIIDSSGYPLMILREDLDEMK